MGLIGSAVNTLTLGAVGSRDPEPVVLRDGGNGTWVPQEGFKENTQYGRTEALGVAGATMAGVGLVGLAQATKSSLHLARGGIAARVIGAAQAVVAGSTLLGAGLVGTNVLESDMVKLTFKDVNGDPVYDDKGPIEQVVERSTYEAYLEVPR